MAVNFLRGLWDTKVYTKENSVKFELIVQQTNVDYLLLTYTSVVICMMNFLNASHLVPPKVRTLLQVSVITLLEHSSDS